MCRLFDFDRDSNWHTMLYLIRCSFAIAAGSSSSFFVAKDIMKPQSLPSDEGKLVLVESRKLFRLFANDGEKGKKERGYLLALLEISRESRRRDWDEGKFESPLLFLVQNLICCLCRQKIRCLN